MSKAPAGVALVRVDNRLVHGQVLEAWLPALDAHGILVADDEAAGNVLAVAMMTGAGTACLVTAARPRERRHAMLSVVVAKLTSSALAAVHLLGAGRSRALAAVFMTDLPLLLLTVVVYRSAAPGIHSAPARELPPSAIEERPKIQLKVSK